jgi:hypothetical protein
MLPCGATCLFTTIEQYNTIFLNLLRFGLVFVDEMKGKQHKQICGHRLGIINNVNEIVFQQFK